LAGVWGPPMLRPSVKRRSGPPVGCRFETVACPKTASSTMSSRGGSFPPEPKVRRLIARGGRIRNFSSGASGAADAILPAKTDPGKNANRCCTCRTQGRESVSQRRSAYGRPRPAVKHPRWEP
jgi:hypothetical protein